MKFFIVLAACIVGSFAAPSSYGYSKPAEVRFSAYEAPAPVVKSSYDSYAAPVTVIREHIPIVKHHYSADNNGNFNLEVESGNGITKSETGTLKQLPEGAAVVKSGSYSFTAPDGQVFTVNYTADENGFHPTGTHLPTPPPMSEEIAKSLALPRIPEYQDGYVAPTATVVRTTNTYAAPALKAANYY